MHIQPYMVLGSALVGFLVGMTGAGGGALMTPMLILLFKVKPSTAISSDLVAAVLMRPVGALVHLGKKTINFRLVGLMCAGSVPAAFFGSYLLHLMTKKSSTSAQTNIEIALGAALLLGAVAMAVRMVLDRRAGNQRQGVVRNIEPRAIQTVLIGVIGGLIVGMTSVGSGSLMIVLLLFVYPMLGANQLVGTDLTQAVPLTMAAALGALIWGHVEMSVTTSIVLGSVPAVVVGALLSSWAPDKIVRPAVMFVVFVSGLKYVGMSTSDLGWSILALAVVATVAFLAVPKIWRREPLVVVESEPELALVTAGTASPAAS